MSFFIVFLQKNLVLQTLLISAVLLMYFAFFFISLPWKIKWLNYVDALKKVLLILVLAMYIFLAIKQRNGNIDFRGKEGFFKYALLILLCLILLMLPLFILLALIGTMLGRTQKYFNETTQTTAF